MHVCVCKYSLCVCMHDCMNERMNVLMVYTEQC